MCTSEASSANTPDPGLPPDSRAALVRHIEKLEELTRNAHQNPQLSQQRIDLIQTILNQPAVDQVHDLRAALLHDLGRAYSELPAQDRTPNLECAIRCYREALDLRQGQETTKYADTQRNLGDAYAELTTGDRGANLQKAIDCYQRSLAVFTMESSPQDYALIQNQLGIAYAELPTDDAQSSLQQAIHCFREALRFYPPEQAAEAYADVQNNLGIVYSRLHIGDRAENLQRAIACYEEALRFRLSKSDSLAYALTQINLGNAYAELSVSRAMNLRRAITCYQEALENCPATEHPYLYAMIQDNLGSAYSDLPDGNRAKNLRKAIDYYEHALHFRTPTAFPHDYAMTQNNLGVAYCDLTTGDRLANLRHATDCLQQALTIYTREETPLDYAMTQNNLGTAYAELAKLGVPSGWEQALTCYRQALRIYALETFPADHLMSAYNLGKLHFEQRHWCKAHSAYQMAIAADGRLYQTAVTETSRLSEAAEAANLYRNDAYCLARLGRYAEAVECLEAGRARVLADALKRGHALLDRAPSRDRDEFRAIIARIRSLEAQAHEMMGMGRSKGKASGFVEITKQRRTLRARLTRVVERVRARFPEFMPSALDMRAIASAVPPGRPLVFLVTSSEGSMALIVPPAMDRLDEQHVVWMDSFAEDRLDYVLHHYQVGAGLSRDLSPPDRKPFRDLVAESLPVLGEHLLHPLAVRLQALGYSRCVLVPCGPLSLLPLHAARLPDGRYIDESLETAYIPSASALYYAPPKRREPGKKLLMVVDPPHRQKVTLDGVPLLLPTPELRFGRLEASSVAALFPNSNAHILWEEVATRETVLSQAPGYSHLHFACHGCFEPFQPLASYLALAGQDRLTLSDLLGRADLSRVQLAVLAACQTAITDFRETPDEAVGLPAGLLRAGVSAVVGTLWPVNDVSTGLLLTRFYQLHLQDSLPPATALRQAQRWLRESTAGEMDLADYYERAYRGSGQREEHLLRRVRYYREHADEKPFAHPYYWAAFTFTGVGDSNSGPPGES